MIARDQFAHRCYTREYDYLGRWMVLTFRGKEGLVLRVVTAYRPIPGSGPYTVYQQQVEYYSSKDNNKCPITNYDNDLTKIIEEWIEGGDQVILMIDANEALQNNKKGSFRRRMEDIGMNEIILNHHPHLQPPSTTPPGTNTIDSIFGTGSLIVKKSWL